VLGILDTSIEKKLKNKFIVFNNILLKLKLIMLTDLSKTNCLTYHNQNQIIVHNPNGSWTTFNINPYTLKLSNPIYGYELKISEYDKLLKICLHNCTLIADIGGIHVKPETELIDNTILCKITLSGIFYHSIQLHLTQIDKNKSFSIDLYFSDELTKLTPDVIKNIKTTKTTKNLCISNDDFFHNDKFKVMDGMIGIIT
jgi:hypothetical protein